MIKNKIKFISNLIVYLFVVINVFTTSFALQPSSRLEEETKTFSKAVVREDEHYGSVVLESFNPAWLNDFPQVIDHVESEHALHVKGVDEDNRGLTWHAGKFLSDMDAQFDPAAVVPGSNKIGFQMKLGYFIVPFSKILKSEASSLSLGIAKEMEVRDANGNLAGYRFFVHPSAYDHFRVLHGHQGLVYVSSEDSEYIGTPTSSYRSWIVRRVKEGQGNWEPANGSVPFIIKLGVEGSVLGSDRWLSTGEIERSIRSQIAFDEMDRTRFKGTVPGGDFFVFKETMGLVLDLPAYCESVEKASGVIVREFPEEFLNGECRIISFAGLMSAERVKTENRGLCAIHPSTSVGTEQLPLIYDVIQATMNAGLARSPEEFLEKFLITGYLTVIKHVTFEEGLRIEPHAQNLLMVLNNDNTPRGFAYRDHGGVWVDLATRGMKGKSNLPFYRAKGEAHKLFKSQNFITKGYIDSYSWFYRYQVFVKLLNTMVKIPSGEEYLPPPPGAPIQKNQTGPSCERALQKYLIAHLKEKVSTNNIALKTLEDLSISFEQYNALLKKLDQRYLALLDEYFDLEKIQIPLDENGCLPAAGNSGDKVYYTHKGFLGNDRHSSSEMGRRAIRVSFQKFPPDLISQIKNRMITSFGNTSLEELKVEDVLILQDGLALVNQEQQVVGFVPYAIPNESEILLKQLNVY